MRLASICDVAPQHKVEPWRQYDVARGPRVRIRRRRDGVKREQPHCLLTREVKTDERQDFFCDFRPVCCVLPQEISELRFQLAAPRLPCFQVRCLFLCCTCK